MNVGPRSSEDGKTHHFCNRISRFAAALEDAGMSCANDLEEAVRQRGLLALNLLDRHSGSRVSHAQERAMLPELADSEFEQWKFAATMSPRLSMTLIWHAG
jgi:hypothetical protein